MAVTVDPRLKQLTTQNNTYKQTMNPAPKPVSPTAPVDPNQYRTQTATINDVASKYGFDFSRDYANRQAEAEAQAKRNANADAQRRNTANRDFNLAQIDNNVKTANRGLDTSYFQQYMNQAQNQVNSGINGGIAADQNLRLNMNRQSEMADIYNQANLGRMQENQRFSLDDVRLAEELGLINQQGLARAESLFNDRLMQGAGLAQNLDQFNLQQNNMLLDAAMQTRSQNIGVDQFNKSFAQQLKEFQQSEYWNRVQQANNTRDYNRGVLESDRGYNYQVGRDQVGDSQWNKQFGLEQSKFDWSKYMDGQNLGLSRARLAQDSKLAQAAQTNAKVPSYEAMIQQMLDEMDYDTYKKMREGSLKADPNATTGIMAQPGSYWYARGYGNQYLPK